MSGEVAQQNPSEAEKIWEKPITNENIEKLSRNWSLAGDAGVCFL